MLFGKEHVERYEQTDGAEGHEWQGTTALILTTRGRKSGETRRTPLIYQRNGDDVLIVASRGGDPKPPAWYLNLQDEPLVGVQIADDRFSARARDATDAERAQLWSVMTAAWPAYDEYQEKTDRPIPIVVLEREG
ncbi:MAG TPA: nitroreductase family deazaflavin-dependent oxidoreductase [Conexibacter sp.]|nr:nitroreductase family deazaflavin-dependent oxidoreductase [Conexibacter sp.]